MNGQAVAVQLLREAGNILIDIHGQHEFQSLTRSAAQRELLDGYGRLEQAAGQVGIMHRVWLEMLNRTLDLESKARDRDAKLELLRYQVSELNALQLKAGEFETLVDERARLANRGKLAEATQTALTLLYEGRRRQRACRCEPRPAGATRTRERGSETQRHGAFRGRGGDSDSRSGAGVGPLSRRARVGHHAAGGGGKPAGCH